MLEIELKNQYHTIKHSKELEPIKKLSKAEFDSTFIPPMNFMDIGDETSEIDLKLFVESIIEIENINKSLKDFSIDSIYHNADKTFEHILLNYGIDNIFIVLIIKLNNKEIIGYFNLDLNEEYKTN